MKEGRKEGRKKGRKEGIAKLSQSVRVVFVALKQNKTKQN